MKIQIINGPNLNLLGKREPHVYGSINFSTFITTLQAEFPNIHMDTFQSNIEGELIDKLHEVGYIYHGVILNAGGYTHTSIAIHDAIAAIKTPVVEVHISNLYTREKYRHTSLITSQCVGLISGFGLPGYRLAITYFMNHLNAS